jgi:hypothetical protein
VRASSVMGVEFLPVPDATYASGNSEQPVRRHEGWSASRGSIWPSSPPWQFFVEHPAGERAPPIVTVGATITLTARSCPPAVGDSCPRASPAVGACDTAPDAAGRLLDGSCGARSKPVGPSQATRGVITSSPAASTTTKATASASSSRVSREAGRFVGPLK